MKAPPDDVIEQRHIPAQQIVVESGVRKIAEVVPSALTKMSVQRISRGSGMDMYKQSFADQVDAEKWLDED